MDKEKITDKIKKLLALSQSSNEHEAQLALMNARKLMAEHKLTFQDVDDANSHGKVITLETDISYTMRTTAHVNRIVAAIIEHSPVEFYMRRAHGARTYRIVMVGYESDVAATLEIIRYALGHVDRHAKKRRAEMRKAGHNARTINGEIISYGMGFAKGIEAAFREQNANTDEYAVVLVTPAEVTAAMPGNLRANRSRCSAPMSDSAYDSGFSAGKSCATSRHTITEGTQ